MEDPHEQPDSLERLETGHVGGDVLDAAGRAAVACDDGLDDRLVEWRAEAGVARALAPLLVLWFGYGALPKVLVVAKDYGTAAGSFDERVTAAANVLEELGGVVEIETTDDGFVLRGRSCPLAIVVPGHPEACQLAEALPSEVIGSPVHERCERTDDPRRYFEVPFRPPARRAKRGV